MGGEYGEMDTYFKLFLGIKWIHVLMSYLTHMGPVTFLGGYVGRINSD